MSSSCSHLQHCMLNGPPPAASTVNDPTTLTPLEWAQQQLRTAACYLFWGGARESHNHSAINSMHQAVSRGQSCPSACVAGAQQPPAADYAASMQAELPAAAVHCWRVRSLRCLPLPEPFEQAPLLQQHVPRKPVPWSLLHAPRAGQLGPPPLTQLHPPGLWLLRCAPPPHCISAVQHLPVAQSRTVLSSCSTSAFIKARVGNWRHCSTRRQPDCTASYTMIALAVATE